jgi:surface protein
MSVILNGNKILQSKSISYEIIDDMPLLASYSVDNWTRPTDWISVPTPATGSEVAYLLVGIYETGPNFLTIQGAGTFSINWGDGSTQSVSSGSYARKEFTWGSFSAGTLTTEGFRQALVTVTPNTPGTFTTFDLDNFHSYSSTNYRANVLEIKMSGPNLTSLVLQRVDKIRNFEFIGTHSITNFSSLLISCEGLRKVNIDCQGVTNTSSMFQNCHNLREVDITNLNSVTNMSSMFNACYSLNTLPTINADWNVDDWLHCP